MTSNNVSIGQYLANRVEALGIKDYFAIPGDYNLTLLDEFLKNPNLRMCEISLGK